MACELNKTFLVGNLTADPKVRIVSNDRAVCHFTLASNRRFKTADGLAKEDVLFIDCEAWGRTAELVGQYLTKGSSCLVDGRLKLDSWVDKDGGKRSKIVLVAESVQFLNKSNREGGEDTRDAREDQETANPPQTVARPAASRASRPAPAPVPVSAPGDDEPPF